MRYRKWKVEKRNILALSGKQLKWADAYLGEAKFNKTEAARIAGYRGDDKSLANIGYQNYRKLEIKEYIEKRLSESVMSADEALQHLSDIARPPVSHFDFFAHEVASIKSEDGDGEEVEVIRTVINAEMVKEYGHLIRTISFTNAGPKIEFYSRMDALQLIGKHYQLFEPREQQPQETIQYTPEQWRQEQERRRTEADKTLSKFEDAKD